MGLAYSVITTHIAGLAAKRKAPVKKYRQIRSLNRLPDYRQAMNGMYRAVCWWTTKKSVKEKEGFLWPRL